MKNEGFLSKICLHKLSFSPKKGLFDRSAKHKCVFWTLLNVYYDSFCENSELLKTINYFPKKTP